MTKPITPLVGVTVFIPDDSGRALLIRRSDNGFWCLPGGFQELSETPAECAVRECTEETGLEIILVRLVGVFSSTKYEWVNYPWKENVITDIVFQGRVIGGELTRSSESTDLNWFTEDKLPQLSDGHIQRLTVGFSLLKNPNISSHFE